MRKTKVIPFDTLKEKKELYVIVSEKLNYLEEYAKKHGYCYADGSVNKQLLEEFFGYSDLAIKLLEAIRSEEE